jgi:hypothetical protein
MLPGSWGWPAGRKPTRFAEVRRQAAGSKSGGCEFSFPSRLTPKISRRKRLLPKQVPRREVASARFDHPASEEQRVRVYFR